MGLIIGIDEAGRGPLAGPVSVSAFGAEKKMQKWLLRNIFENKLRDSKKLLPKKREEIYEKLCQLKKEGKVFFSVCHVPNKIIDKKGISFAIKSGVEKSLADILRDCPKIRDPAFAESFGKVKREKVDNQEKLKIDNCELKIVLDGLLKAPAEFENQKTIIKGDEKDVFIACASIAAKVERDRLICRLSLKYPLYNLHIHKGYSTKLHLSLLQKHGLSDLHRKSFCKNL